MGTARKDAGLDRARHSKEPPKTSRRKRRIGHTIKKALRAIPRKRKHKEVDGSHDFISLRRMR